MNKCKECKEFSLTFDSWGFCKLWEGYVSRESGAFCPGHEKVRVRTPRLK